MEQTKIDYEKDTPTEAAPVVSIRVIDWLRPDHALLRGLAMAKSEPTPRNNRLPHQGEQEAARRKTQRAKGMLKP